MEDLRVRIYLSLRCKNLPLDLCHFLRPAQKECFKIFYNVLNEGYSGYITVINCKTLDV
jgi:hypothetical protein